VKVALECLVEWRGDSEGVFGESRSKHFRDEGLRSGDLDLTPLHVSLGLARLA
jgi:hypothetical protein